MATGLKTPGKPAGHAPLIIAPHRLSCAPPRETLASGMVSSPASRGGRWPYGAFLTGCHGHLLRPRKPLAMPPSLQLHAFALLSVVDGPRILPRRVGRPCSPPPDGGFLLPAVSISPLAFTLARLISRARTPRRSRTHPRNPRSGLLPSSGAGPPRRGRRPSGRSRASCGCPST